MLLIMCLAAAAAEKCPYPLLGENVWLSHWHSCCHYLQKLSQQHYGFDDGNIKSRPEGEITVCVFVCVVCNLSTVLQPHSLL